MSTNTGKGVDVTEEFNEEFDKLQIAVGNLVDQCRNAILQDAEYADEIVALTTNVTELSNLLERERTDHSLSQTQSAELRQRTARTIVDMTNRLDTLKGKIVQNAEISQQALERISQEVNAHRIPGVKHMRNEIQTAAKKIRFEPISAAGSFLKSVGFRPGRNKGYEPGTFITPMTLFRYMKMYRSALGLPYTSTFDPETPGYIPYSIVGNGLVQINGGIPLADLKAGKEIQWKQSSKLPMNSEIAEAIYEAAMNMKRETVTNLKETVKKTEEAIASLAAVHPV